MRLKRSKLSPLLLLGLISIVALLFYLRETKKEPGPTPESAPQTEVAVPPRPDLNPNETHSPKPDSLPTTKSLTVPFLVQAPFGVWDYLHDEACEEASLIMIKHYLFGTTIKSKDSGDREIKALVAHEESRGYGADVTIAELAKIGADYYGLKSGRVGRDISVDNIKREIAAGRPVIVPAAGKILPNPNFRNGGPYYHMLVITGYDQDGFVTNDPGTKNGEGFRYTYDALYNAIHDYNAQDMLLGAKNYLVFD
ncbi:MAG: C39 family peptidase [Patescibacteria group bacterium]